MIGSRQLARIAIAIALFVSAAPARAEEPSTGPWCDPSVSEIAEGVCHFSPAPDDPPDTLVIFLHGVIKVGTDWQYAQQQALARFARQNRFEVLLPRGRVGAGSKKFADHWNWPTSAEGQKQFEDEVIAEWMSAKAELEKRYGRPFARVYLFGFSAGAYYTASLALRGKLKLDGYAVFAGGGAPDHVERWARGTHPKPPIYVGWGTKDKARKDPQKLAKALAKMKWKHRSKARPKVGHTMTDAQVREAFEFLGKSSERASVKRASN